MSEQVELNNHPSPPARRPARRPVAEASVAAKAAAAPRSPKQRLDTVPEFTLLLETCDDTQPGRWRFKVRSADGNQQFEASDVEPDTRGERLSLLTVVRALEALEGPSRVTLIGVSRYVRQGIVYGLPEWRENGWRWEYFGRMVPVRDRDLWQRLDRALQFHQVECRLWRCDPAHPAPGAGAMHRCKKSPARRLPRGLRAIWCWARGWFEWAGRIRRFRHLLKPHSRHGLAQAAG